MNLQYLTLLNGKIKLLDQAVEGIFYTLNKNKFNYAIINNYKSLPSVKNDIDILTNEDSEKNFKIY